jgi:isoquinoline 1-oxidoreductase beta subunit
VLGARYSVGLAPSAALETLTATAQVSGDRLEIWAPTQAPGLARAAAARAAGMSEDRVTVYPMLVGSGYGRKIETDAIEQAAAITMRLGRPVQLTWPRIEELKRDSFRAPAVGSMTAVFGPGAVLTGWQARIAAPPTTAQVAERLAVPRLGGPDASAVAGAVPPYSIPSVVVDYLPAEIAFRTGLWRSGAHSYSCFFTECFVDELARRAGIEPLSFRMQMLGGNPRLARCLSTAAALGGWDGGQAGSNMGIAAHSAFGSHIALLVEVAVTREQRVRVLRAVAAVDCGRIIHPEIVKQLVEGGIVYGIAGATGNPIEIRDGMPTARTIADLRLPVLAGSPEVTVEIVESQEDPGGVTELGVPPAGPAVANALHALTGRRLRSLPLVIGGR